MQRRLRTGLLLALACTAGALLASGAPVQATTTPPAVGDWTIDAGEAAYLNSTSTVVAGNIWANGALFVNAGTLLVGGNLTVNGSFTSDASTATLSGNVTVGGSFLARNATLELWTPLAGVTPSLLVTATGHLALENTTLTAGPSASDRFTMDGLPGATLGVNDSTITRLASSTQGNLSLVGIHLRGALLRAVASDINGSDGGIGLDEGASLDAETLNVTVRDRALSLTGGSTATLRGFTARGSFAGTDFLVIADNSSLTATDSSLHDATNLLLVLSGTAMLTNVTLEHAVRTCALLFGANLTVDGGLLAPRSNGSIGVESYASDATMRADFRNYTYGISALGSTFDVENSSFETSSEVPKSSFTGIYTFDTVLRVADSRFNGTYHVTDIPLIVNGSVVINTTTGKNETVPVFDCSNSAMWVVRSNVRVESVATACFNEHFHAEESNSVIRTLVMENGTLGANFFHGSVDGWNLTATNFTNPSSTGTVLTFLRASGTMRKVAGSGNDVAAEFRDSDLTLSDLTSGTPGLGVYVRTGSPTIENSTFTIHNETGVKVQDGAPTLRGNTFWLTANNRETEGVNVTGGAPLITGNAFHGAYTFTYGVRVWAGAAVVDGNTFETLERGAVFFSKGFLASNNLFRSCWNGAESREFSAGTIRGNLFENLTEVGTGTGINTLYAGSVIEGNTFVNVNYGVKVFFYTAAEPAGARVSLNSFQDVAFYAIEVWNASQALLIDNNTVRNATRGGIEALFSTIVSAYNVVFDGPGNGIELTQSAATVVGGRLENLSEGIHANVSSVVLQYTTIVLNHLGMIVQDGPASLANSSFQFNGIAAEFVSNQVIDIVDSIFVGNVEAILSFGTSDIRVRDTNFVGTLDFVIHNDQLSTGSFSFTRRGEINGGRIFLRGALTSTGDGIAVKSVRMQFDIPPYGSPGISIRGAGQFALSDVSLSNSSVPFYFEIESSTGTLSQVTMRGVTGGPANPGEGPLFANATLNLRNVLVNESFSNFTVRNSLLSVSNLTLRDNPGVGVTLEASALSGASLAVLDNALCGVEAAAGSLLNGTNVTVRGNRGGSLCFNASRATVFEGDFSSGPLDVALALGSDVSLISTTLARGYLVNDTSRLTISWYLDIRVGYPNALLLPSVVVSVVDAKGLSVTAHPDITGQVRGLLPFAEMVVTSSGEDLRSPYTVSAGLGAALASAVVVLNQDRLVQLDLNDTLPPDVVIESPNESQGFANATVTLRFHASDAGSGLQQLQYRFGAGAFTAVSVAPGTVEIVRDLVDGLHTMVVRATDFAGNVREASVNFTVDTRAPIITVVTPRAPANLTSGATISVQVTVEPDVVAVSIGGVNVTILSSAAVRVVDLPEGDFQIVVEAVDHVGNRANLTVYVRSDRTPPWIHLENPGNSTFESFVVLRGQAEPGSVVVIGGTPVPTSNGSFEALVPLHEATNVIEVHAKDSLLNENISRVTIVRGVLQPSHLLDTVGLLVGALALAGAAALTFVTYRRALRAPPGPPRGGAS